MWTNIQPKNLENSLKDLNWLCFLRRLPVNEILYRHGLAKDGRCPREGCSGEETIRHAFWECAFAQSVWTKGERLLRMISGSFKVSCENVMAGIRCKRGEGKDVLLLWLIMSLIKKGLWEERKRIRRGKGKNSAEGLIRGVEAELKGRIRWDNQRWGKHAARER